jgi:putative MATE family efflux protein
MSKPIDFKTDNLWMLMMRMAIPGILGTLLVSINAFVDAIYVGYFINQDALAGVSLVFPFTIITSAVMVFIAYGSSSVLSRAIGAADTKVQQQVYSHVLTLSIITSVLLTVSGYFLADKFIVWMGGSGALLTYGTDYYRIYVLGTFFNVFGMASNALIRAEGKMKQAMSFTGIAVALNILLTPFFIHIGELGTAGAALASVIAMAVYTFLTTRYLLSAKPSFEVGDTKLKIKKEILFQIIGVGFSAFLLQATSFVRQSMMFRAVAHYGSDADLAFFAAVFRMFSFSVIPVFGLLQSLQPIVGINHGAGYYERSNQAVRVFRTGGMGLLVLIWIPVMLFPTAGLSLMLPDRIFSESELFHVRIVFLIMPMIPLASSGIIYFQAIGKGKLSSMLSIGREVLLFIPMIFIIPVYYGVNGIYYSIALENFLYIIIVFIIVQLELKSIYKTQPNALV